MLTKATGLVTGPRLITLVNNHFEKALVKPFWGSQCKYKAVIISKKKQEVSFKNLQFAEEWLLIENINIQKMSWQYK